MAIFFTPKVYSWQNSGIFCEPKYFLVTRIPRIHHYFHVCTEGKSHHRCMAERNLERLSVSLLWRADRRTDRQKKQLIGARAFALPKNYHKAEYFQHRLQMRGWGIFFWGVGKWWHFLGGKKGGGFKRLKFLFLFGEGGILYRVWV